MTFDQPQHARQARDNHRRTGWSRYTRVNYYIFTLSLCLFLLISAGCAQADTNSAGSSGVNTPHAQSSQQITYVAIGASDTFGLGTDNPYDENWATDLADLLGSSHIHLINLGIPGITAHDALKLELPIALDAHPDLVTIWLGVNDIIDKVSPASYANDLNALLSHLRERSPHARIAIANIPDLTLLPYFAQDDLQTLTQQVQAYNTIIASAAQQHQAILVDLTAQNYNLQDHPEYISDDGLHPTDLGYLQLARLFYQALQHH